MNKEKTVLGIDTSNYTTSIALVNHKGEKIEDYRKLLTVKLGERGLRQSEAVFQHMLNFPELFTDLLRSQKVGGLDIKEALNLRAIAVSARPRPKEGSYMPCFRAGISFAEVLAESLGLPLYEVSHQEGHIEAGLYGSNIQMDEFVAWHLSGGTCELLKVRKNNAGSKTYYDIDIIGGSEDISIGQLLDRVGVKLGLAFPCGAEMDKLACKHNGGENKATDLMFKKIKNKGLYFNLSGIETQTMRYIEKSVSEGKHLSNIAEEVAFELFVLIYDLLKKISILAMEEYGSELLLFSGGVAASTYIRASFSEREKEKILKEKKCLIKFSDAKLSSDNAVGVALLGRELLNASNKNI